MFATNHNTHLFICFRLYLLGTGACLYTCCRLVPLVVQNEDLLYLSRSCSAFRCFYYSQFCQWPVKFFILPAGFHWRIHEFLHKDSSRAHSTRPEAECSRKLLHGTYLQSWGSWAACWYLAVNKFNWALFLTKETRCCDHGPGVSCQTSIFAVNKAPWRLYRQSTPVFVQEPGINIIPRYQCLHPEVPRSAPGRYHYARATGAWWNKDNLGKLYSFKKERKSGSRQRHSIKRWNQFCSGARSLILWSKDPKHFQPIRRRSTRLQKKYVIRLWSVSYPTHRLLQQNSCCLIM